MPTFLALLLAMLLVLSVSAGAQGLGGRMGEKGVHSVTSFGAKGDGTTDDTQAFQKALDAASKDGGGIVFVATGNYLIKGHLSIPDHVTLEGVFRAPTRSTQYKGSTLLAVEGKGNEEADPFLHLGTNSTLRGITVFYPEQDKENPVPYPWCVRGQGDNCSIVDVLLVNPWKAVDFGTFNCGRHLIRGLYSQPLKTGIFVDKCYDVGRIENVHLWPFWHIPLNKFTEKNATAFIFGRTDWEFVSGCFCISYKIGFQFSDFGSGPGNVVISNSGSDVGPCAVLVENCQGHAGIAWTNGQIMAGVQIKDTNTGPVKFNNCGFWGVSSTTSHAEIEGSGHVTFNACHFISWDQAGTDAPAISANGSGVTVTSCDFMDGGKKQVVLGEKVKAAVITSNRMRGGLRVENGSTGKVEMGMNVDQ